MPHANNAEMNAANAQRMCKDLDLNDPRMCWFIEDIVWEWTDKAQTLLGKEYSTNNAASVTSIIRNSILPTFYEVQEGRGYAYVNDIRALSQDIDAKIKATPQAQNDGAAFLKLYGAANTTLAQILSAMLRFSILNTSESKQGVVDELLHKTRALSPVEILLHIYNEVPPTELWIGAGMNAYEASPGGHWPYHWIILRQSMAERVRRWYTMLPKLHLSVEEFHLRKMTFTAYYGVYDTIVSENSKETSEARKIFNELKDFARERKENGTGNRQQVEKHSTADEIQRAFDKFVREHRLRFSLSDAKIYKSKSRNPRGYVVDTTTEDSRPRSNQKFDKGVKKDDNKSKTSKHLKVKKKIDKTNLTCNQCGEKGHFKAQCPQHTKKTTKATITDMEA